MSWCTNCNRHAEKGYRVGHCAGNSCNRCPWPGCPCTHDGGCDRGYIETEPADDTSNGAVRRCAVCWEWAAALKLAPHDPAEMWRRSA